MIVNNPPSAQPTPPPTPPDRPSRSTDNPPPDRPSRSTDPVQTGRYQFKTASYIWFVTAILELFLGGDFVLRLLAASHASTFVGFVYAIGGFFAGPFHGIWPATSNDNSYFDPAILVAMLVYLLLAWGIVRLIKIISAPHGTKPAA